MLPEEVGGRTGIGNILSEQGLVKLVMDLQVNSRVSGPLLDSPGRMRSGELASALLCLKLGRITKRRF